MAANLEKILDNVREIYLTDSSLATLLDFERVIDEIDLYSYKNWKMGELIEGPIYEKYFVTCTFMWPYKMMPDPRGGERLLDYDCEVYYSKDTLEYPIKVENPDDFEPGTKMPRMAQTPVWLVEITMPKNLMSDIRTGSVELEDQEIDLGELDDAYDIDLDKATNQVDDQSDQSAPPLDTSGQGDDTQPQI